jgi:hypothetical protein
MMIVRVRACASPSDKKPLALPKRVARARRVTDPKRVNIMKKTVKEKEFVDSFFKKTEDMWKEIEAINEYGLIDDDE